MLAAIGHIRWFRAFAALILIASSGCASVPSLPQPFRLLPQRQALPGKLTTASETVGDSSDYALASHSRRALSQSQRSTSSCRTGFG